MVVRGVVCGMELEADTAFPTAEFESKTYHFCAEQCRQHFTRHPAWYATLESGAQKAVKGHYRSR